jgi:hypothetical protein
MTLSYRPLTKEDVARINESLLLPKGQYTFYVENISQQKSQGGIDKKGNPKKIYDMLVVNLRVSCNDGDTKSLRDWVMIVDSDDTMGFKLRHFAEACGLLDKYEAKTLKATDFMNKNGVVKIGIRESTDQFGDKVKQNSVMDYVKPNPSNESNFFNDDIPI